MLRLGKVFAPTSSPISENISDMVGHGYRVPPHATIDPAHVIRTYTFFGTTSCSTLPLAYRFHLTPDNQPLFQNLLCCHRRARVAGCSLFCGGCQYAAASIEDKSYDVYGPGIAAADIFYHFWNNRVCWSIPRHSLPYQNSYRDSRSSADWFSPSTVNVLE